MRKMKVLGYGATYISSLTVIQHFSGSELAWLNQKNGHDIDGFVQERHNSSALAMELRFSFTNLSIYVYEYTCI